MKETIEGIKQFVQCTFILTVGLSPVAVAGYIAFHFIEKYW